MALLGKIDKLPVLRSLDIVIQSVPDSGAELTADTANDQAKYLIQLFNDNQYNNPENPGSDYDWNGKHPNLLGMASKVINKTATTGLFEETLNYHRQYQGGVPLKPKMTVRNEAGVTNNVVASAIIRGALGHCKIFMEIDWVSISKNEFDEYIREYIFTQETAS